MAILQPGADTFFEICAMTGILEHSGGKQERNSASGGRIHREMEAFFRTDSAQAEDIILLVDTGPETVEPDSVLNHGCYLSPRWTGTRLRFRNAHEVSIRPQR